MLSQCKKGPGLTLTADIQDKGPGEIGAPGASVRAFNECLFYSRRVATGFVLNGLNLIGINCAFCYGQLRILRNRQVG